MSKLTINGKEIRQWLWELYLSGILAKDKDLISPHISYSDEGELNFYWKSNDGFVLDLGVTEEGIWSYYCQLPDGTDVIEDNFDVTKGLPEEISEFIVKKEGC